jgi:hypothetical protein
MIKIGKKYLKRTVFQEMVIFFLGIRITKNGKGCGNLEIHLFGLWRWITIRVTEGKFESQLLDLLDKKCGW